MDIRELRTVKPVSTTFHGLPIIYNADAFTGDLLRRAADKFREMFGKSIDETISEPPAKRKRKKKTDSPVNETDDVVERIAKGLEQTADRVDRPRDYFAALLAGTTEVPVLMSWELTDNDIPIPCNLEGLKRLDTEILQELYGFIRDHPLPKSPEIPTTRAKRTISETTEDGSSAQAIPLDASPSM